MTLVQDLAQKDYEEKLLKVINEQLTPLQQFLQNFHLSSLSEVYEHMSKDRKVLINAHVLSDEAFAKIWQKKPYVSKSFAVNDPEIYTEKNERLRSKSEKILADKFFTKEIPYKYECPLNLNGYGTVYLDCTLLNKKTREVFFWEHLGMMDNPSYGEKALLKIESYEKNGIYPGKQLILTHETASRPLNIKIVESLIKELLI